MSRFLCLLCVAAAVSSAHGQNIPLPEHPRPDLERPNWVNLNGAWDFRFGDTPTSKANTIAGMNAPADAGTSSGSAYPLSITVPFSWGAPLSGIADEGDVGWYRRTVEIPADWDGRRVFLVVGAADWRTTAWLDGYELGTHQGGYTPFEFELTPHVTPGQRHELVLRVDDTEHAFKLEGKQGYGPARGIWQTPYLEARGDVPIDYIHFTPDIDDAKATVDVKLLEAAPRDLTLHLAVRGAKGEWTVDQNIPAGSDLSTFDLAILDPILWTLDNPHLYDVTATLAGEDLDSDVVNTYFGMREIGVVNLPGTDYPYIALNGEPVYLETALDQAYHPEGYYTFPSDAFMRDEILRSRQIGLNGMRIHVKIGIPRKLYWADKLGMLIMADVPNSWGEPTPEMRSEVEYALREMIERDYNHPAIFSWVPFNESWGLQTPVENEGQFEGNVIRPETQEWVVSVYRLAKELDPTRLVEDNSVCCFGHTETDINSWHVYTTGYAMPEHLDRIVAETYPGSEWNFLDGRTQGRQPLFNSEFGNVWGYEGSAGDVDWSWDYHIFMNEFRMHPKIAGWLYTEHHDVINEWNGYWRYDRSEKYTGMEELVDGMSLRDLHAPFYVAVGERGTLTTEVETGAAVEVPIWASFMTGSDAFGDELTLRHRLYGWDKLGRRHEFGSGSTGVAYRPWRSEALEALRVEMPDRPGLAILAVELVDAGGNVLHRNFTSFVVEGLPAADAPRIVTVEPHEFTAADWSLKQWNVLDGRKVNGAGSGFFEYRIPWPDDLAPEDVETAAFVFEASAKQLYGKDVDEGADVQGDFMRGGGTHDPSANPNAYPMTDEDRFPSAVTLKFGDHVAGTYELADDPADHRGLLSWHSQRQDRRLREAGSYGWLIEAPLPRAVMAEAVESGELVVRLEVSEALPHGLAIYGERFGRYPVDPSLVVVEKARGDSRGSEGVAR